MFETVLYVVSGLWLGALHAATPGHGKTITAAYLVGVRGRPTDALVLGIFVTLAHTSGIIAFALLATLGSVLLSQRAEAYLGLATGLLVVGLGVTMAGAQWPAVWRRDADGSRVGDGSHHAGHHRHGWGPAHSHQVDLAGADRPSWLVLLALGVAGGLLPDPAALAALLAAIASGQIVLGVLTVIAFSVGFAAVLVTVGVAAATVGQRLLAWSSHPRLAALQLATSVAIAVVGVVLTVGAIRALTI
jgi:nickel/cobalt exporter